jgi:hypothetical protein
MAFMRNLFPALATLHTLCIPPSVSVISSLLQGDVPCAEFPTISGSQDSSARQKHISGYK